PGPSSLVKLLVHASLEHNSCCALGPRHLRLPLRQGGGLAVPEHLVGPATSLGSPKVQVYTRNPPGSKEPNFLNCYVEGFHPPVIDIQLLKNGKEMEGVVVSDLSFSNDWTFQRLVYAKFTPSPSDIYSCRVTHVSLAQPKDVKWDPDN
ncbi:beta-2-microglobulin, partial [Alligator sinensis]|uniref:Beta-2-microglobulin n=1 Tax=Alligator sinensis TaxID=38654 RepID=A0A3Q0G7R7_ALLSI